MPDSIHVVADCQEFVEQTLHHLPFDGAPPHRAPLLSRVRRFGVEIATGDERRQRRAGEHARPDVLPTERVAMDGVAAVLATAVLFVCHVRLLLASAGESVAEADAVVIRYANDLGWDVDTQKSTA
jgi:hypothetical protein